MSPKTTCPPSASLVASAHARGLFGWLLVAAVAIFGATSAHANAVPLYSFSGSDGAYPTAALVQGSDGDFYGTTYQGGGGDRGTVFKITSGGTLTTLYNFNWSDGASPLAGLVQGSDGDFYGTTLEGGVTPAGPAYGSCGTVFKITSGGSLTTLHNFIGCTRNDTGEGSRPYAGLVQGSDGDFYGTTSGGGAFGGGSGTVFKITSGGSLTTLYSFSCCNGLYVDGDGAYPLAGLVQGSDGDFYGTTSTGGAFGIGGAFGEYGTVFKITSGGSLTTLYSFSGGDGSAPHAGLVQGSDGNFYGTTSSGGAGGGGTVFKITSGGGLTTLYNFSSGAYPVGVLAQGRDGLFYGTTTNGGSSGVGTVFTITSGGSLTTLYNFSNGDGAYPSAGLAQGSDDLFYGTTAGGGAGSAGTVFQISATITPPTSNDLIATIATLGLPAGAATSLTAPLGQVSALLNDNNPANDIAACNKLDAFIKQVGAKLKNGNLTQLQANDLKAAADVIKTGLGCRP